jgi:hypothetical protein
MYEHFIAYLLTAPDALRSLLLLPRSLSPFPIMPSKRKASPPTQPRKKRQQVKRPGTKPYLLGKTPTVVKDQQRTKNDSASAWSRVRQESGNQQQSRNNKESGIEPGLRVKGSAETYDKKNIKAFDSKKDTQSSKRRQWQKAMPDSKSTDEDDLRELTAEEIPIKEKIVIVID